MGNIWSQIMEALGLDLSSEDPGSPVDPDSGVALLQARASQPIDARNSSIKSPVQALQVDVAWDALRRATEDLLHEKGTKLDFTPESFDIENDLNLERPVRIAILDTGVDLDHEALIGRVVRLRNFVPGWLQEDATEDLQTDSAGRGTFMAALAVGGTYSASSDDLYAKDSAFRNGVAPFAKLVIGKVLSNQYKGDTEWLVKGLKWACDIEKTDSRRLINADIVCISTGLPRYSPDLRLVIYEALAKGKVIICASNTEEPGSSYHIHYPARFGDVICVGSQSENGTPSVFTPPGREMEFLGPGEDIWSASSKGPHRVTRRSGPYVAVPYIAAVCALVIAYAEKVGGQELRRVVTHTHVMKKILMRMSSTTAGSHHDPLAGYGNIVPARVLKYGSTFFINIIKDIFGVRDKKGLMRTEHKVAVSKDPLRPTITHFNAAFIAARVPSDKELPRSLLRSMLTDKTIHQWYTGLEVLLTGPAFEQPNIVQPKIAHTWPEHMALVDLSLPPSSSQLTVTVQGLNVERIINTYFSTFKGEVRKVVLPEFRHIVQFDHNSKLRLLNPDIVHLPGTTPVHYLFRVMNSLLDKSVVRIVVDVLDFDILTALYPSEVAFISRALQKYECNQTDMKIFIKEIIGDSPEELEYVLNSIVTYSTKAFGDLVETKFVLSEMTQEKRSLKTLFYLESESSELAMDDRLLPESSQQDPNCDHWSCFCLKQELTKIFFSNNREKVLRDLPPKFKLLKTSVMKSYEAALNLLRRCNMTDMVTCIDIRFEEPYLKIPDLTLKNLNIDDDTLISMPEEMLNTSSLTISDRRSTSLAKVFSDLVANIKDSLIIEDLVVPSVSQILDLAETMSSPVLRHCRNLYIPGETAFFDLLLMLRHLPRAEYPLTLHVEHLRLTMLIGTTTSRDFECPPGVRIIIYHYVIDHTFLQVPVEKASGIYEILLRFSSRRLLEVVRDMCSAFISEPDDNLVPFNCLGSYAICSALLNYLKEALRENMIDEDQSILTFSKEIFKLRHLTAAVGPRRFRLAFRSTTEGEESKKLAPNFYRPVLMENKTLMIKWKQGKLQDTVVAILGLGINAYHPEFYSKSSRDTSGAFGDKLVGVAYNAIPEESLQSIVDDDCTIGTVAAALVTGSTCGAAPFSKVISIKVGRCSGHTRIDWMVAGLKYLVEQESSGLLPQSDIVLIPLTFASFDFDLYSLINKLCQSGKIIVCAAGNTSVLDADTIHYPGFYGDVLCIGSHGANGEPSPFTGKGREVDLLALGELPCGGDLNEHWSTAIAASHITGVVAHLLAYAESIGGPSLRQVISNNHVMREILRRMCSKPGQHDEKTGHGNLNPGQILRHGDDFFRQMVSELTEEYSAIIARRQSLVYAHQEEAQQQVAQKAAAPRVSNVLRPLIKDKSVPLPVTTWRPRRRGYSECSASSGISDN